jgi:hypothetical protein
MPSKRKNNDSTSTTTCSGGDSVQAPRPGDKKEVRKEVKEEVKKYDSSKKIKIEGVDKADAYLSAM